MRSSSIHVLAPGATIVITVDPPIDEANERPYVATMRGRNSVVVHPIDTTRVAISNPTKQLAPFVFFVATSRIALPPGLARFLGGF